MTYAVVWKLSAIQDSSEPGFRLWYEDVLGVFYRIDEAAMTVEVLYAGPSRRRP